MLHNKVVLVTILYLIGLHGCDGSSSNLRRNLAGGIDGHAEMEAAAKTSKMPPPSEPEDPYKNFLSDEKVLSSSSSSSSSKGSRNLDTSTVPQEAPNLKAVPQEAPVKKVPQEAPNTNAIKGVPQEAPTTSSRESTSISKGVTSATIKGVPQEAPNTNPNTRPHVLQTITSQYLPQFIDLVSDSVSQIHGEVKEHLTMNNLKGAFKTVKDEFHEHVTSEFNEHVTPMIGGSAGGKERGVNVPYKDFIPTSGSSRAENQKIMDLAREAPASYDDKGKMVMPDRAPQKATVGEGVPKDPSVVAAAGVEFVDVVDQKTDKKLENAKIIQANIANIERMKQVQIQKP